MYVYFRIVQLHHAEAFDTEGKEREERRETAIELGEKSVVESGIEIKG